METYRNLAELQQRQAQRLGPAVALRYKQHGLYHDVSWADYHALSLACAAALVDVGVRPGDRVGLLADNRVEWLIADMGILLAGAVNVPPHAPLSARQIQYQLHDAGARWLFVDNAEQLAKVQSLRTELPDLEGIVMFDAPAAGMAARSWRGFLQRGRAALKRHQDELTHRRLNLGPDHLATIMYTSGTTGNPKGVMLSHGNLVSNAVASDQASPRAPGAILLNWLPFSHIYARTVDHYLSLVAGVPLALAESHETVVRNIGEIQPTHLSSVPRLYEKILAAVQGGVETRGLTSPAQGEAMQPPAWHARLRAFFGSRIDWLGAGGAPLAQHVALAFQQAGLLILQGYGLTESSPVISFNRKTQYRLDSVGLAIPGVEVRIAPDGEILTRGPHVMDGYWKDPAATEATIREGWLHTGDLGRLDDEGFLYVTGRKKELLVLSNGKKVAPNQVEALLLADPCLDQVVVVGEGRNFLSALIVPHWANLKKELAAQQIPVGPDISLGQDPRVIALVQARLDQALADLSPWERVKRFVLLDEPFSVTAGELTVSLKLRRTVIVEHHRAELENLYGKEGH